MRVLKLLARVAFICNICFVLASLILWLRHPPEGQVVSTVIVMGYLMGLPLNAIVFGWMLVLRTKWRRRAVAFPGWVIAFNVVVACLHLLSLIQHLT